VAAVVDPQRDVGRYVEGARRIGCRIRHVFLTHFHADFVAGHLELRDREGATIHLGARARAEYEFLPATDGATIELGPEVEVRLGDGPWQEARLVGERKRHSWQWWELIARVDRPGTIALRARATDLAGRTQPAQQEWNRLGYGNNAVRAVPVNVR
jgi:hypothetical protein